MSETPGDELIAFIKARLDEDEAAALPFGHTIWRDEGPSIGVILVDGEALIEGHITGLTTHIARHDPARVLRDVAAKRAILDWLGHQDRVYGDYSVIETLERVVRDLAAEFSDHPDYRPEWSPDAD